MSWLRIDDRMASHPKIAQLTDREFRVWMRLLSFCAAYQDPSVDKIALSEVTGLSSAMVTRFAMLDLLDVAGDSFEIHDWSHFQPKDLTGAERQAKWRARRADEGDQFDSRSSEWKQTRAAVLDRDHGICCDCGKDCKTPKDGRDLWNADHEPHRDDLIAAGASIYDISHIVTRCHSCHAKKTRAEAKRRKEINGLVTDSLSDRPVTFAGGVRVTSRVDARARPVPSRPEKHSCFQILGNG